MLVVPRKIHEDHFDDKATPMIEFWARGHGVSILTACYALTKLDADTAAKIALYWVAGIGLTYPFNAKFGFFSDTYKPKYPMHYVPEALMTALLVGGVVAE